MNRIMIGAVIAALVLIGTIYLELHSSAEPDIATVTSGRSPLAGTVRAAPSLASMNVVQGWATTVLGRPLFRSDRRPPQTAGEAVTKADDVLRLTGVITGPFGNRAIFMSGKNPQPIVAKEGTRLSDFVVRSIRPDEVVVDTDGNLRTLKPAFAEGAKPPHR
jgi:hypothetical protein